MTGIFANMDEVNSLLNIVITLVAYVYCLGFIVKVKRKGTDTQKMIVRNASSGALITTLSVFIAIYLLAIVLYFLGMAHVLEQINLSDSALPIDIWIIIPLFFYASYKYEQRLVEKNMEKSQ